MAEIAKIRGNKYYSEKKYSRALSCYTAAIDKDPENFTLYSNRAAAYIMMEKFEEALSDCQKAISIDETYTKARVRGAKCLMMLGRLTEAKQVYDEIISKNSQFSAELNSEMNVLELLITTYKEGVEHMKNRRVHKALSSFLLCNEKAPGCKDYILLISECYARSNNETKCMHWLSKLKVSNNSDDVSYIKCLLYISLNKQNQAKSILSDILSKNPQNEKAKTLYNHLVNYQSVKDEASKLFSNKLYEKAIIIYKKLLDYQSSTCNILATLYTNIATCYSKLNKNDDSIKYCTYSIEADNSYTKALFRRAKSYQDNNQHDLAVKDYQSILDREKTNHNMMLLEEARKLESKSKTDLYKLLGVSKDATIDEIKKSYRKKALIHHPDRHTHKEDHIKAKEEQIFKNINEAYSILSDTKKRANYDRGGMDGINGINLGGAGQMNPNDIFNMFFNGGARPSGGQRFSTSRSNSNGNFSQVFFSSSDQNGGTYQFRF